MMYEVQDGMAPHARVIVVEPKEGWTRPFYDRQIAQYVSDRGSAPRTVTLHPETMGSLEFSDSWIDATEPARPGDPLLISSTDYARDAITLYE